MRLSYSADAIEDLKRLHDFLLPKSPLSARKAAIEIQQAAEKLKTFPRIGLLVSKAEDPESIRDLIIGKYVIRYLIESETELVVLRVWHQREAERSNIG